MLRKIFRWRYKVKRKGSRSVGREEEKIGRPDKGGAWARETGPCTGGNEEDGWLQRDDS
jgi:hypothetical protein